MIVDESLGENAGEDESASLGSVTVLGSDLFVANSATGQDDEGADRGIDVTLQRHLEGVVVEAGMAAVAAVFDYDFVDRDFILVKDRMNVLGVTSLGDTHRITPRHQCGSPHVISKEHDDVGS